MTRELDLGTEGYPLSSLFLEGTVLPTLLTGGDDFKDAAFRVQCVVENNWTA